MALDRTKCTAIIQNVLAATEKQEIVSEIKSTPFSILIDESTDVAGNKHLCLLVRYISPKKGEIRTPLLEMIKLDATDCSAKALYKKFKETMNKYEVPIGNIIGLACDNASVMVGVNESFYTELKADCDKVILLSCICHSAHLAASKACVKLPGTVQTLLRKLSSYVSGNPKRNAILQEFQEHYHSTTKKLLKLSFTRWLVLQPCVQRILDNLVPLQQYFIYCSVTDKKDREAAEILDGLQNPFIKGYLMFLRYSLDYFNKLNGIFQSEKVLIHKLQELSLNLLKQICQNFIVEEQIKHLATVNVAHPHFIKQLDDVFLGPEVNDVLNAIPAYTDSSGKRTKEQLQSERESDIKTFRLKCLDFYIAAGQEVQARLPLRNQLLKEAAFVDPVTALKGSARVGDLLELKNLRDNFKDKWTIDGCKLVKEWRDLPYDVPQSETERLVKLDPPQFWQEIKCMTDYNNQPKFQNLHKLACLVMALPHSNADAERAFSVVTDTKTKKRNRMGTCTLDSICVTRIAFQQKKLRCFEFKVTEKHVEKHNVKMYALNDEKSQSEM